MGDILEKIFAIILVVILMFFFPLLDAFERMDDLSYMTVYAATVKFVDAVRLTGHITPEMYTEFEQKLNSTGNKYNIEMTHRKNMYYPAEDKKDLEEGHKSIRLEEEFNTQQILYTMGYYSYDETTKTFNQSKPTDSYANFSIGDYFYVYVENTSATPATVIKRVIYGNNVTDLSIMVPYGGIVQNDANKKLLEIETTGTITWEEEGEEPGEEVTPTGVKLATVAKVGDFVAYKPYDGDTFVPKTVYTPDSSVTGYSRWDNSPIHRVERNWMVLSNDGINVTLIAAETSLQDYWVGLGGKEGAINGPQILDDICYELYSKTGVGVARNLKIEDILQYTEFIEFTHSDSFNIYQDERNGKKIEIPQILRGVLNDTYWFSSNKEYYHEAVNAISYYLYYVANGYVDIGNYFSEALSGGTLAQHKVTGEAGIKPVVVLNADVTVPIEQASDATRGSTISHAWELEE